MSEAVDTRIVEAKFDSSQFEKGVDRTVKKLDELKKSMTFEQTGKSIADLTSKAQEATEKASNSLEKLEDRITSFTGMLRQKLLGGIADEIVGAVFKVKNAIEGLVTSLSTAQISAGMSKYEQMLTSVRTMIAAGDTEASAYKAIETLGLYADQTSYSLDQMTSALSKMRAAGVDLDTGTKAVEGISNACAAAGVNAMDASRAFFNLSQAYSSGYLKYTDYRSLELLNMTTENFKNQMLEAAVAAGTLKKESEGVYKTINKNDKKVSAGKKVTTKNVTDALRYNFMNTEAMNKLFGEKYFFDEKAWKEIKKEYDDLGKSEAEALAEAKVRYGEIAVNAYFAAREAKSFTDVIGTLKDVISRGWSKSFELIFGKLEEAKDFFTWLTESEFANAIYSIGEFRNRVLEIWKNSGGRDDFIQALHNIDEALGSILGQFSFLNSESDDFDKNTTNLGASLVALSRDFKNFTQEIKDWLTEDPDKDGVTRATRIREAFANLGKVLRGVLAALKIGFNFVIRIFTVLEPVFSKFYEQFENLFGIFAEFMNPAKEAGEPSAYKNLNNILGNVANVAEKVTPILETLIDVLGKVAAFFLETAIGTFNSNLQLIGDFLGFIIELFGGTSEQKVTDGIGVIEGIQKDIEQLGEACKEAISFVGDFFSSLFEDLRNLFGFGEKTEGVEEGGFFSNIVNFFNTNEFIVKVKDWINTAIEDIGKFIKDIPNKIVSLGNIIWDALNGIFWNKDYSEATYQNIKRFSTVDAEKYKEGMKTPFLKFVENIGKTIKDFFVSLPDRIVDFVGNVGDFITTAVNAVFDFFLGEKKTETASDENGKLIETTARDKMNSGYENLKTAIVDFVRSIPGKIMSVLNGLWKTISGVAGKIWNFVDELLFGKKVKDYKWDTKNKKMVWVTRRIKTGFSKWLDDTITSVKEFFTNPEKIKAVWDTIVDFFFGRKATDADLNKINPKTGEAYKITDRVKEGFSEWLDNTITTVLDWIRSIPEKISQIWNKIIDFIFGREATETDTKTINPVTGKNYKPTERVKEGFSLWLHNVWTNIKTWFTSGQILKDLKGIWNTVIDFIFGKEGTITVEDPETGEKNQMTGRVKEGFSKWLDDTVKTVSAWVRGSHDTIKKLWNMVLSAIFGGPESKGFDQSAYDQLLKDDPTGYGAHQYKEYFDNKKGGIIEAADEFLKGIGVDLGALIRNIPTYIVQGWDFSVDLFGSLLEAIDGFFKRQNDPEKYKKLIEEDSKDVVNAITEGTKDGANKDNAADDATSGFLEVIISIGQKIARLITTTIPSVLSGAWTWISDQSGNLFDAISGIFNDSGFNWKDVETSATNIANKVANVIEGIPSTIRGAVEGIKKAFDPYTDAEKQITDYYKRLGGGQILESQRSEYERTLAYAKQQIESSPKKSGIFGAIKTIGSSIGSALGDLGPDILNGLNEAFKFIGDKTTEFTKKLAEKPNDQPFFEWLTGLIGGEDGESSALAESVKNIGETLKNLIVNVIPNFLGEAFAELAAGIPRFIQSLFGGGDNKEAEDAAKESGSELGDSVKQGMLDGFKEAFGADSVSLNNDSNFAWLNPLNWLVGNAEASEADGAKEAVNQLGIAINNTDEVAKKAEELAEKQKKIKEINDKLNAAREEQIAAAKTGNKDELPRILKEIKKYEDELEKLGATESNIVNNTSESSEGIESTKGHVLSFLDIFKDITGAINGFANSNVIGTVAIVAGIIYALHAIKDMLSIGDEAENIGYAAKWEAIKIAIIGLVGLLGYMIYLSATGNETQLKNIERTFDKVVSVLEHFSYVLIALKAIKLVNSGVQAYGNIQGAVKEAGGSVNAITKWFKGSMGKTAGIILGGATVVGVGGDIITEALSNWSGNLTETFEKVGIGMDDLIKSVNDLASIGDKIDAAKESIKRISELFAELREIFVEDVVTPAEESGTGAETISKRNFTGEFMDIIKMFIQLSGAVAQFKTAITTYGGNTIGVTTALNDLLGMKDSMKEFGEFATSKAFTDFKLALMSIGSALEFYSLANIEDFNKPLKDWQIDNAIALLKQMFGNNELQQLVEAAAGPGVFTDAKFDEKELLENAEHLVLFAGALTAIGNACQELNENDTDDINKLFTMVQGIKLPEGNDVSSFAQQFGILGNALGTFAIETSGLTDTNVKTAGTALDMLLRIAQGLKDIPNDSVLAKAFAGDKTLEAFGVGVQALGGNLKAFFEAIQNLNSVGASVEYNRKNTEQVLMAIDALSQAAVRIGKVSYVNDALKNADSWLAAALGNLSGFGTNIMKFIDEINSYNTTDNKAINFDFVYSAIDAIGKLTLYMDKVSNLGSIETKVKNVGELLIGNGTSHNGVMGWLNQFFAKVIDITQRDKVQFDLKTTTDVITAYATMVTQIVDLIKEIHAKDENLLRVGDTTNPMEYLIPVFSSVNDNYSVFETFLNNASKFNQVGILNAQNFFSALHDLATGLFIFSQQDSNGDFNVLKGLSTLMNFNWESLASVKDNLSNIFKSDELQSLGIIAGQSLDQGIADGINTGIAIDAAKSLVTAIEAAVNDQEIKPKITPILDIDNPEFIASANRMREMLGYNPMVEVNGTLDTSLHLADAVKIPEQKDYSEALKEINHTLSQVYDGVDDFKSVLNNVKFIIEGKEFSYTIGPDIDEYLGRESVYLTRRI